MSLAIKPVYPVENSHGINLRELFAAMCMQGFLANCADSNDCGINGLAHDAVLAADALIEALERGKG